MPPTPAAPTRALLDALRPMRRRPRCDCLRTRNGPRQFPSSSRHVSTAIPQLSEMEVDSEAPPRWSQTPHMLRNPGGVTLRKNPEYEVNSDPQALDAVYTRFLGPDGDKLLSEEAKWLAVTHKSFDHGRRGYNERLAYFGKRILELQTSLVMLSTWETPKRETYPDPHGRTPFRHPATDAVECLAGSARAWFTHSKQIASIAEQYGIPGVVRWQPKHAGDLGSSGSHMVYAQATFAIIGALALEQGAAVANRIAKERIIQPLRARGNTAQISGSSQA